jgi:hypothetical protein
MYAIKPTPLLIEHRRLLSSLAAITADESHADEAVDAVCDGLSEVERKILATPIRSRADVLARLEVAEYANIGCADSSTGDDLAVAGLISAARAMLEDAA